MSAVTAVPIRPLARGSMLKLWLALIVLCVAGGALAWAGTSHVQRTTTASGLQYQVIREGEGELVTSNDALRIHLVGRRENGEIFASTLNAQPEETTPDSFIPGFGEALKLMRKGSRYRVWIPPHLGYQGNAAADRAVRPERDPDLRHPGRRRRAGRGADAPDAAAPANATDAADARRRAGWRLAGRVAPAGTGRAAWRSAAGARTRWSGRTGDRPLISRARACAWPRLADLGGGAASNSSSSDFCSSAAFIIATIGSASARPMIPNRAPKTTCAPSTRAGARSTVFLRDIRHDEIAVDDLDDDIDRDRPEPRLDVHREADQDDQRRRR